MWIKRIFQKTITNTRSLNNLSFSITKTHRSLYCRTYPTVLIQPDGSSINIRYHEPRKIIKLPLDLSTLSEEDMKIRLENRRPRVEVKKIEEIEDNFNAKKYLSYMKKPKK